jgi:hypothetical protein
MTSVLNLFHDLAPVYSLRGALWNSSALLIQEGIHQGIFEEVQQRNVEVKRIDWAISLRGFNK